MLYFVRHGQCEANAQNVFAGQRNDSPLTEIGKEQARAAGQAVAALNVSFDRIISSPLSRTRDTAVFVAEAIGFDPAQIQIDPRITEYDMGSLTGTSREGVTSATIATPSDAEPIEKFQERVMTAVREYAAMPGNTLLVSHAGVGRIIEGTKQGTDPARFYDIPAYANGSVVKIEL